MRRGAASQTQTTAAVALRSDLRVEPFGDTLQLPCVLDDEAVLVLADQPLLSELPTKVYDAPGAAAK